jgi:hypothetical protein
MYHHAVESTYHVHTERLDLEREHGQLLEGRSDTTEVWWSFVERGRDSDLHIHKRRGELVTGKRVATQLMLVIQRQRENE